MKRRILFGVVYVIAVTAGAIWVYSQEANQRTARELFYEGTKASAGARPQVKGKTPAGPARGKKTTREGNKSAVVPAGNETAASSQPVTGGAVTSPAASAQDYPRPFGLRYALKQRSVSGEYLEVPLNSTFHSGDGIRVAVEGNDDGYLYIINKGSSGAWTLLFPSSHTDIGSNRVVAHTTNEVPGGTEFTFVDKPGEEHVYIVFSRQPEKDLEQLIHSLRIPGSGREKNPAKTAGTQAPANPDDVMNTISTLRSRDLIVSDPSTAAEKAVYVMDPAGGVSSRVVVNLKLIHR